MFPFFRNAILLTLPVNAHFAQKDSARDKLDVAEEAVRQLAGVVQNSVMGQCPSDDCRAGSDLCSTPACGETFGPENGFQCESNNASNESLTSCTCELSGSQSSSTVFIPVGASLDETNSMNFLCAGRKLDSFVGALPSELQYYAADRQGIVRMWPGQIQPRSATQCSDFNVFERPWYQAALSGAKNLVLIIDTSLSMTLRDIPVDASSTPGAIFPTRIEFVQQAVQTLIQGLTVSDFVGVVQFAETAEIVGGGNDMLAMVADEKENVLSNIATLKTYDTSATYFGPAFEKAFDLLARNPRTSCRNIIVLMTDGVPDDPFDETERTNWLTFIAANPDAILPGDGSGRQTIVINGKHRRGIDAAVWNTAITEGQAKLSSPSQISGITFSSTARELLKSEWPRFLACAHSGIYTHVEGYENPTAALIQALSTAETAGSSLQWSSPWQNHKNETVVSVSTSVGGSQGSALSTGVVAIDIRVEDLGIHHDSDLLWLLTEILQRSSCTTISACELQQIRAAIGSFICDAPSPSLESCAETAAPTECSLAPNDINEMLCQPIDPTTGLTEDGTSRKTLDELKCCDCPDPGSNSSSVDEDEDEDSDDESDEDAAGSSSSNNEPLDSSSTGDSTGSSAEPASSTGDSTSSSNGPSDLPFTGGGTGSSAASSIEGSTSSSTDNGPSESSSTGGNSTSAETPEPNLTNNDTATCAGKDTGFHTIRGMESIYCLEDAALLQNYLSNCTEYKVRDSVGPTTCGFLSAAAVQRLAFANAVQVKLVDIGRGEVEGGLSAVRALNRTNGTWHADDVVFTDVDDSSNATGSWCWDAANESQSCPRPDGWPDMFVSCLESCVHWTTTGPVLGRRQTESSHKSQFHSRDASIPPTGSQTWLVMNSPDDVFARKTDAPGIAGRSADDSCRVLGIACWLYALIAALLCCLCCSIACCVAARCRWSQKSEEYRPVEEPTAQTKSVNVLAEPPEEPEQTIASQERTPSPPTEEPVVTQREAPQITQESPVKEEEPKVESDGSSSDPDEEDEAKNAAMKAALRRVSAALHWARGTHAPLRDDNARLQLGETEKFVEESADNVSKHRSSSVISGIGSKSFVSKRAQSLAGTTASFEGGVPAVTVVGAPSRLDNAEPIVDLSQVTQTRMTAYEGVDHSGSLPMRLPTYAAADSENATNATSGTTHAQQQEQQQQLISLDEPIITSMNEGNAEANHHHHSDLAQLVNSSSRSSTPDIIGYGAETL